MAVHLFLLPHQDDETPVLHQIESLAAQKEHLLIAFLTSGTFSGAPAPVRDAESLDVLGRIGVQPSAVRFIGTELKVPDGDLMPHLDALYRSLMEQVQLSGGLASLCVPAWEGGHQDHDAAHLLGLAIAKSCSALERASQFPYYHGRDLPGILFRTLQPLASNGTPITHRLSWGQRLRFMGYLTRYRSQWSSWIGLGPFFVLHYLFWGTQVRQPVSTSRVFERPHEGPMLYERRRFSSYERFLAATQQFRDRHLAQT